jgi:glyoxylase-like metal-dependent hydrolase (beta-lactamase superfamily II)
MELVRLGSIAVAAVSDGHLEFRVPEAFPGRSAGDFRAHGGVAGETWVAPLVTFVLRAAGRTLLVDTGIGRSTAPYPGESGGLPAGLARAGVAPEAVDAVIFTHLHLDHVGWNFTRAADGIPRPTFPNARYIVHRPEWDYWQTRDWPYLPRRVWPLAETGQLDLVADDHEVAPGVQLLATPGHTPGHVSVLVQDGREGAVITGDAAHHPVQLEQPEWSPTFDADRTRSAETRAALAERIERDGLVALGGHFPAPHGGRLLRVEQGRVYRPLPGP